MQLELNRIVIDGGTQPRVAIDDAVVADYAEALREGAAFPPVVVFHDGAKYWLADGFHRYHAHRQAGLDCIEAHVHEGTRREAILFSVGANSDHGLRRTNGDKRKAVLVLLNDDMWSTWSNVEIARHCAVDEKTVRIHRKELTSEIPKSTPRTYRHNKSGQPTQMKTGNIGQGKRRAKSTARLAADALKPTRNPHGEDGPVPMKAISLPLNNPRQAAASMIGLYGETYMTELMTELKRLLKDTPHACN